MFLFNIGTIIYSAYRLKSLGASDYGLYYVVGGVVTMFSFIGGSLSSGSQRFIAYALGKDDVRLLKQTFDTTLSIYIVFAIISFVVLELAGVWFLNCQMNIPTDKLTAANWVYSIFVIGFCY